MSDEREDRLERRIGNIERRFGDLEDKFVKAANEMTSELRRVRVALVGDAELHVEGQRQQIATVRDDIQRIYRAFYWFMGVSSPLVLGAVLTAVLVLWYQGRAILDKSGYAVVPRVAIPEPATTASHETVEEAKRKLLTELCLEGKIDESECRQ